MDSTYLAADTSLEAIRVQNAVYRRLSPQRRLEQAFEMTASIRRFSLGQASFRKGFGSMTQEEFVLQLVGWLEQCGIPYMIAGSHSSSCHGQPRTTNDVDVVIDPTAEQLEAFLSLLSDCYVSPEAAREALARRSMFNIIDFNEGWKADLIIRKDRRFSIEEFGRRQIHTLYGRPLAIASPEDVILSKLEWDRITPSERQRRDALNVAAVQGPALDQEYLRKWAVELGVREQLEEVLRHAQQQQPG